MEYSDDLHFSKVSKISKVPRFSKVPKFSQMQTRHKQGGSPLKDDKHSHSPKDGRPKKGGSGGKGTWGGLLETEEGHALDLNDPNYDSTEECDHTNVRKSAEEFAEYKKKAAVIVEEYFATDDVVSTASELREISLPRYNFYFVKKLVSMAMDRHDKEKEMAAVLLSALYADVIDPSQVYKGFGKLVESSDDLIVDIPDTIDVLALFVARAVVDDILPPAFLTKHLASLPKDSKGVQVLRRAEKGYLAAPLHAEIIERRWGGSKNTTVEDVKARINNLLVEYRVSGDVKEACRCIKDLKVPFFHHEIIKRALIMAMERRHAEDRLLDLLKAAAEEEYIEVTNLQGSIRGLVVCLIFEVLSLEPEKRSLKIMLPELSSSRPNLLSKNISSQAIFQKEKEMASILLSSLCFPADDVVNGFVMLIESADDTALDIPVVVEDLAMFLARAVVDEVLAPQHLEEIGSQCLSPDSIGSKVLQMAKSLLKARLSGERILRCWGGGGSGSTARAVEDVKDKIGKLLEEYESGGDFREACRCIKELGMPFFHHEVVKKALVTVIEKKNERLWRLLRECFGSGLITMYQMMKGFSRVGEALDDLALDVPDAKKQFTYYVEQAKIAGWLDASFSISKPEHAAENGSCL
ncbi:Programmed cell death protein 4 [Vitis vinifera]|uniref:Programmed cell death protein 4 n=1 Tax=Vitis vinifera TaxID=29760 RepID=A0A438IDV7_VITVI|nr:Programmed cell death protein 4 [Vitis vinifera]